MAKMEKSYPLRATVPGAKFNIVLLGAGGTGGQVLAQVAKIKALGLDNSKIGNFDLTLVDGDEVESKNCTRQNFFEMDIGGNKAEILAARYGEAYGTDIGYVDHYIEGEDELAKIVGSSVGATPIIIGCVDNHKTRLMIDKVFTKTNGIFWVDSGNEEFGGQVVCGYNNRRGSREIRRVGTDINTRMRRQRDFMKSFRFDLPSVTEIYPEIGRKSDLKFNSELSCAERAESSPQNIIVNSMAAQVVMMFVRKILISEDITSHCVTYSIRSMSARTMFNKNSTIKEVMKRYDEVMTAPEPEAEVVVDEQPIE